MLLFVAVTAASVAGWMNAGAVAGDLVMRTGLSISALCLAAGALSRQWPWFADGAPVWTGAGWTQFLLATYLLTFPGVAYWSLGRPESVAVERDALWQAALWVPLGLAMTAWMAVAAAARRGVDGGQEVAWRYEDWVPLLAAVLAALFAYLPMERED